MVLLYLTVAYLSGIALGQLAWRAGLIDCAFPAWFWLLPLSLLPLTPLLNRLSPAVHGQTPAQPTLRWPLDAGFVAPAQPPRLGLWIALLLAMLAGGLRYASHPVSPCWTPADLAYYNAPATDGFAADVPTVTVTGYVNGYPLIQGRRQQFQLHVDSLEMNGTSRPVAGEARLSTGTTHHYRYGQPLRVTGRLEDPPTFEDFNYQEYLSRKGIHSLINRPRIEPMAAPNQGKRLFQLLYSLRQRGERLLDHLLPEPYAALANGMLLGIEAGIPDDLYEQFNLTGTSHVIVISGSNVAIIAAVLMAAGVRLFGRRRALGPTLAGIGLYALLVGGDAAVMRAALMGGLFVIATTIDRQSTALVSLAVACWVMTLANPLTLWDVGFQLSSAATAGLILFTPGLTAGLEQIWPGLQGGHLTGSAPFGAGTALLWGVLQDGLLVTVAANLTTLPLVVHYFGRLSVVSLLTNLLIAPVQPFIMLWGGAGLLVGMLGLQPIAQMLLWVPYLSLVWTVAMVKWSAALPGASLAVAGYGSGALLVTYLLLATVRWRSWLSAQFARLGHVHIGERFWRRLVGNGTLAGLAVVCFLVWRIVLSQPDGRLHVYFLDIGQGDGIFVQTPGGRQVLIDGGSDPSRLFTELGDVMPFWDHSIDLLVLTHPDNDHMGAQVALPTRYDVGAALDTAASQANPDEERWRAALDAAHVPIHLQHRGGWVDLGDGAALWVLWPPPEGYKGDDADNQNSLVTKLVYGELDVLLTGDLGLPGEEILMRTNGPVVADVLKVGHHGSHSGTGPGFVRAVDPAVAVIQVGENRYGHPHQEVLDTLAGRLLLRNDEQGRVHIWSDGQHMWIEAERQFALDSLE